MSEPLGFFFISVGITRGEGIVRVVVFVFVVMVETFFWQIIKFKIRMCVTKFSN